MNAAFVFPGYPPPPHPPPSTNIVMGGIRRWLVSKCDTFFVHTLWLFSFDLQALCSSCKKRCARLAWQDSGTYMCSVIYIPVVPARGGAEVAYSSKKNVSRPCPPLFSQRKTRQSLYAPHSILHSSHCKLHARHYTIYTSQSTLHTSHYFLQTSHCTPHAPHFTLL